jgi:hypothetical protein
MGKTIRHSVGRGGTNRPDDVAVVQTLLNAVIDQLVPLRSLSASGRCDPTTVAAITEFQRRVVGLIHPDGRVDPGGRTLAALNASGSPALVPPPPAPTAAFAVQFRHSGKTPDSTSKPHGTAALYESAVTVTGPKGGAFRGSIYPDDLSERGRLKDGTYDLYLGFHKRHGHTPSAKDLVVRENGFRAALIVNDDKPVPVLSDKPGKVTSEAIHVHNGFHSQRFSDGCPTLHPSDWSGFIRLFLDAFPSLADWTATSTYVGRKIGTLDVRA